MKLTSFQEIVDAAENGTLISFEHDIWISFHAFILYILDTSSHKEWNELHPRFCRGHSSSDRNRLFREQLKYVGRELFNAFLNSDSWVCHKPFNELQPHQLWCIDFDKSLNNFKYLLSKFKLTADNLQFLIDNKLDRFIELLDGSYIKLNISGDIIDPSILKFYDFSKDIVHSILNKLERFISVDNIRKFCIDLSKNKNKKIIIDAGNVLYSVRGEITEDGYNNLINIIEFLKRINYVPIVIIHTRHLKTKYKGKDKDKGIIDCISKIKKINSKYIFETPYQKNDDFYIIYTGFYLSCQIITNDNFKDHIFKFRTNEVESDENEIENCIEDLIIKYESSKKNLGITPSSIQHISKCIQVIDKMVYIPNLNNNFIGYEIS